MTDDELTTLRTFRLNTRVIANNILFNIAHDAWIGPLQAKTIKAMLLALVEEADRTLERFPMEGETLKPVKE